MIKAIGCDIVAVGRIREVVFGGKGARFMKKMLHPVELKVVGKYCDDVDINGNFNDGNVDANANANANGRERLVSFVAGRWAAKEALFKAMSSGGVNKRCDFASVYLDHFDPQSGRNNDNDCSNNIKCGNESSVCSTKNMRGKRNIMQGEVLEREGLIAMTSISHEKEYAMAMVILLQSQQ